MRSSEARMTRPVLLDTAWRVEVALLAFCSAPCEMTGTPSPTGKLIWSSDDPFM